MLDTGYQTLGVSPLAPTVRSEAKSHSRERKQHLPIARDASFR